MHPLPKLHGIGRRSLLAGAGLFAAPAIVRAQGQNGVALVIGNSKYKWEASLPNARRDSADMARCFEAMGLRTELVQDAHRAAMNQALAKFAQASRGARLAAFYFAGHGAAWERQTYLVPVDSDLSDPGTVKDLIRGYAVADAAQGAAERLLVFDNCRNNPADGWRQQATLDRAHAIGLSMTGEGPMPPATIILYSTAPGRAALDGRVGENSPFAAVLLRRLSARTVDLNLLIPQLRRQLLIETEGRQLLWGGHTFGNTPHPVAGTGTPATAPPFRGVDPARLVELKNAYAFANEIKSPMPGGIVAIRPPAGSHGAPLVGAYKFVLRGTLPFLWIVVSAHDGRSAEVITVVRADGKAVWRYFPAAVSGNTMDTLTWSGGQRFVLKWNDKGSGDVTAMGSPNEVKSVPVITPFIRLDG